MEADAASFAQELSASIAQNGSRCATSSPVENRCTALGPSSRGSTSTPTTAFARHTLHGPGLHLRPLLKERSVPFSLAEALECLSTAERELSQFQSFLTNHKHADGAERKCGLRASLQLLELEVEEAKRVCRAMVLAQPPAGVREQLEKVRVQLATARHQRDRELAEVGTSAAARKPLCKTHAVRLFRDPQSGTIHAVRLSRGPPSIGLEANEQSPANVPQRDIAPAAGGCGGRADKKKTRSSLRRWTNRRRPHRAATNTAGSSQEVQHTQAIVHAVSRPIDLHVDGTSSKSLSSVPPLSHPTEINSESAGSAARAQSPCAVGGGRTGSLTPAIRSEQRPQVTSKQQVERVPEPPCTQKARVNAELQVEAEATQEPQVNARVQPVSTDDSVLQGRRRGLWCNLLCCCAPRATRGPHHPSKVPKSRPQAQKRRAKKAAEAAAARTTTGGREIGAGSSHDADALAPDTGNEQIDHAHLTD